MSEIGNMEGSEIITKRKVFFVPTEKNDSRVIGVFADLSKDSS